MEGTKDWGYVIKFIRSTDEACSIVLKFVKKMFKFWTTSKERVAVIYP